MKQIKQVISELFELGGLLTGGAAVAFMLKHDFAKDLDFFFSDKEAYVLAKELYKDHKCLDLCFYNEGLPYDTFDLDISQVYIDSNGNLHKSIRCEEAFKSKTISIIRKNTIAPSITLLRLKWYSVKYKLQTNDDDISFLRKQMCSQIS